MSTEMRDDRPVRTYRGRSLEELIPKIRAELGPDAIILREREGLTGGFNGFFQQRCVEVDAQAPRAVDFYDDDEDALPTDADLDGPGAGGSEPDHHESPTTAFDAPGHVPAPAPASRGGWPHEAAAPTPAPQAPAPAAEPVHAPYSDAAQSYTAAYQPPAPATPPAAIEDVAPASSVTAEPGESGTGLAPAPDPSAVPAATELSFAQRLAQARQERESAISEPPAPAPPAAPERPEVPAPVVDLEAPEPIASEPAPVAPEAPAARTESSFDAPAAEPAPARGNLRVVDRPASAGATVTPIPSAPGRDTAARRPPAALRPFPGAPAPAPGAQLDNAAAGAIARELTGQGISEAWAHELIVTAAAHLTPFTPGGDLRAGVRSVIAGGIMAPPPLPSSGAAVAFIGPGGSGKSRCTAALASAYGRASTLQARVVSLGGGPRAADVAGLLADRDVPVELLHGAAAADAIARGRERGLVVVDTDTTSPVDVQGVAALGDTLAPLGLDAVYLTLPATMSATAARGLLDGLEPLAPSALVITHADEANELGIVAELAYLSGLPIAFIHGGLDLDSALIATDPTGIASRVLP
jgi:hypothetical protein